MNAVLRSFCVPAIPDDERELQLTKFIILLKTKQKMKQKLLMKSLLVAAGLLVGASAWADGNKRMLNSQDYESVATSDWTCTNGNATLQTGDATYGQYAQCTPSGSGNRAISKSVSFSTDPTGCTTSGMTTNGYNIEFDFRLVGGNVVQRSVSQFTVTTSGDPIFSLSQPSLAAEGANEGKGAGSTGTAVTTWYLNDLTNATDETVTLDGSTWYHLKLVVTATSAAYTITNNSNSETVKNGSKTIAEITKITGFGGQVGRGTGKLNFDNLEIYDFTEEIVLSAPVFTFKKVDGIKRVYTLSNPNGEGTLYYTTSPASEAPAKGDAAYTSTTSTSIDVEYSESGKFYAYVLHSGGVATSDIATQNVTAGALTLAEPTFTITDMVKAEDGYYYPKVSFVSTNSLEGDPVPTYSISSPYTFTGIGYIDVTASAEGYTSSTKRYIVSTKYSKSKTIDFGALTAEDFDSEVWTSGTGVPRDLWTNRAAAIPADVPMRKLTNTSNEEGNPDNSSVVDGITISNYYQRAPEFCIGFGMYTPYTAISGSGNNMNFTVNGATAEDYVVYNGWNNYGNGTFNTVKAGNETFSLYRYDTMLRTINVYSPEDLNIIGSVDYSTSYMAAATASQALAQGNKVTYTFKNHGNGVNNYNNWALEMSGTYNGNAYTYGWCGGSHVNNDGANAFTTSVTTDGTYMDWATHNAEMMNGDVTLTAYYYNNGIFTVKSTDLGAAHTYNTWYAFNNAQSGDIALRLGVDGSWLEVTDITTGTATVDVTIGDAGWATLYTPTAVDFAGSGLTAYTATCDGTTVTLTEVSNVPANTGVVLKGAKGTYNLPELASSSTGEGSLLGSVAGATFFDEGTNRYMLALNASGNVQFTKLTEGFITAGKAFLVVPSPVRSLKVVFADETTGINSINADAKAEGVYNLNGQRVANTAKGLYIVNGKKVIVK